MNKTAISIVDTTLRDGLQSPDVVMSKTDKLMIAEMLAASGVDEIEAGVPAKGPAEIEFIRTIAANFGAVLVTPWCRPKLSDLQAALRCKTNSIHISFPLSLSYRKVLGWSRAAILKQCELLVKYAQQEFRYPSVGIQDATRTQFKDIVEFVHCAAAHGARRVRLADTAGIGAPLSIKKLLDGLCARFPCVDFEFHAHNDLGMATANALTAAQCGATALSVAVNGLGERAGNAPLEEVVMALHKSPDYCCRIKTTSLFSLCSAVARVSKRPIAPNKPVTGALVFTHQSGIHSFGLAREPAAFEPFAPETVGRSDHPVMAGPQSGRSTLRLLLNRAGVDIDKSDEEKLLSVVHEEAFRRGKTLSVNEVVALYMKLITPNYLGARAQAG